jgi:uncharacterized repeat protein (TIGR01451 family)
MNPGRFVVGTAALLTLGLAIPARAQIVGFGGTGTNWTLNNDPASQSVPSITNNILLLADSVMTANSAFYDTPQYIGSFTASFVFKNLQANDGEGFVFALQNQGTNAVSAVGGNYLGFYGLSSATGIAFDVSPQGGAGPGLGYAPTQVPGGGPGGYIKTGAVNFRGTNAIAAAISYANGVVTVTVTDTVTQATFSTNFVENLTAAAGGTTAYVGFTGGGTAVLELEISNFVFTPGSQTPVTTSFPVTLSTAGNYDVTKLKGNETDGVIAYNPLIPAEMFVAANTNNGAGLFGAIGSGTSWTPVSLANLPAGANPAVAWDGYGNLFLAYADGSSSGIDVAMSTNGGLQFTLLTNLATGDTALEPRIAVGSGAALGSVWVLYKDFSLPFAPLVAQGAAVTGTNAIGPFGPTQIVPGSTNDCGFGDIAVGPQGQVMVAYQNLFDSPGAATCYVSVNTNGLGPGAFNPPVVAALNAIGGNTLIPASPDGHGINAAAGLAWDTNPASQRYGRAYLVCVGQGTGDATDTDIFLSYSTDSGATWSAQARVNDDSGQNSQFLPRVAVDPTDGALALSWYDCRLDVGPVEITNTVVTNLISTTIVTNADSSLTTNYSTNTVTNIVITTDMTGTLDSLPNDDAMIFGTVSLNGGVSFQSNVNITTDTTNGYEAKLAFSPTDFGDYTGLTFYGGTFYPVWADNSGKAPNPNKPPNSLDVVSASVTLNGLADVSITSVLTNTTNLPQVGSAIYYYLTVSNAGPSAVTAASVTDVFPPEVYVVTAFPTNGTSETSYVLHGNTLTWPVGALGIGSTATMLVRTTAVGIGSATNIATITPGAGVTDLLTNNNTATLVSTIYGAVLNLSATAAPGQIGYGAPSVTYTVTVSNQGPVSATGVLISNELSGNLVLTGVTVPAGDTYTANSSSALVNLGRMTNGQSVTFSLTAYAALSLASQGLGPATCTATALGVINPGTNNTAMAATQIVGPDMAIGMTGAPASITVGDSVTYTVTVTNLGPVPAYGVSVGDALPASLSFASANVPGGSYFVSENIVTANIGFLDVNQTAAFTITASAVAVGQAANVAVVSDDAPDTNPANNSAVVVTPVVSPDMAIGMTGVPGIVVAGQTVTYTINVTNLGPVRATGVAVTNILPANLSFAGAIVPPGTTYGAATGMVGGTIAFAAKQDFATGSWPEAVALGDINGDGKLDIVVANNDAETISVLLNTTPAGAATPTFAPKQDFATAGYSAYSIALADINGDGKPDIVVGYFGSSVVSVFLNTTAPGAATVSFAPRQDISTELDTEVAVADVNGDGKPDLIISHYDETNVSVLLNRTATGAATASFSAAQNFATGSYPWIPAVGDVSNDGQPDIVIPNTADNTVSVLANTTAAGAATPSFAAQQVFATGATPFSVALGDLTGDGKLDLVTANYDASTVSVLLNTTVAGSGLSFAPHVDLQTGAYPWFVCVADLNGDGKPDLISADEGTNTVSVWMNTTSAGAATPSFAARQDFTVGSYPEAVAVGDLNGDGKLDLVVANGLSDTVSVLVNTTSNYTEQVVTFNIGSLASGQSATLTFTATALSAGEATVTGVVGDSLIDTNPGNNSAAVTTTIVPPPPPFSNLTVFPGATSAFITWNTPSNSTGQVDYGLTTPNLASFLNPTLTNYHAVMLTGLVPGASYVFQVRSITDGVLATTNGTFSTISSLILGTADAGYSGPGWLTSGTAEGIFGPNFDYVVGVGGNPTASTTYTPNIPEAGLYDVSIWYPIKPGVFSGSTPMIANGATNAVLASVDQTVNGGSWQPLVTGLYFASGFSGNLTIYNNSGDTTTSVVANGARWVYELSQDTPTNGTVPAWWANFYFGKNVSGSAYANGNAYSNYAEYVLGTDPTSKSSQLQFLVTPGPSTNVTVTFSPYQGGRVYQLLASSNLARPAWVTLTNTPTLNTNNGSGFFTVGRTPGAAVFYRLAVSLSPTQ